MWSITVRILCFLSVSLYLCMSVYLHVSETMCPNFTIFSSHVASLIIVQNVMYFQFKRMGHIQIKKTSHKFSLLLAGVPPVCVRMQWWQSLHCDCLVLVMGVLCYWQQDFALDPDESRMRMAAHHLVRFMTAGMALITCHEPVLISINGQLKNAFLNALGVSSCVIVLFV